MYMYIKMFYNLFTKLKFVNWKLNIETFADALPRLL